MKISQEIRDVREKGMKEKSEEFIGGKRFIAR
jgi:hypothetical protein